MELQKKIILIALVITTLFCFIPGVMGYDTINSYYLNSGTTQGFAWTYQITYKNVSAFDTVTKIEASINGFSDLSSASYVGDLASQNTPGGTSYGNFTATVTCDKTFDYSGKCDWVFNIANFDRKGLTGQQAFYYRNISVNSHFYPLTGNSNFNGTNSYQAALTGNGGFGNGTYTVYSGSAVIPVNATLNVKEINTGTPISGAYIQISNGQSGYSDINGNLTLSITPPSADYTVNITKAGYQNLDNWYLGPAGLNGGYAIFTMTPNGVAGNVTIYVRLKDSESPYALISGSTISVKNNTWFNQTAPTGALAISGADTSGLSALSIGESLTICGSATGYSPECQTITIPYNGYVQNMFLTRTALAPSAGNWNLIVTVLKNRDAQPISSAHVTVQTGVSGPGTYQAGTGDDGVATFLNISASATALVSVVAQGYQSGSAIVTVFPNTTQKVTIELVAIGETPVATPVSPTPTSGYVTIKPTTAIYPTSTSAIHPNPSWTPGGTTGKYSGFFGPVANWFDAMGAGTEFIGTLLAVLFIFIGAAIGGWSSAPYSSSPAFNPVAAGFGALLGFLVAVAAGLISLTLVVIFIFAGVFVWVFFR